VGLALAEGITRSLSPSRLGFLYADGTFQSPPEFERDRRRNGRGFHAPPQPQSRTPGVPRVVLLGDSYVAALSVPLEQTVGTRLEHHLRKELGRPVEVVPLGKPGWGQREQLNALTKRVAKLEPDLVVTLFLSFNDVRDNHAGLDATSQRELLAMRRFRPGWSRIPREEAPLFWIEGSRLNQWLSFRLALGRTDDGDTVPLDYHVYSTAHDPRWEEAWEQTRELLVQCRLLARGNGAQYALVSASTPHGVRGAEAGLARLLESFPAMARGEWDLDLPDRELAEFCAEHRLPFLALEPVFRQDLAAGGEPLHWPIDGHWNAAGNDFAARHMAEFLAPLL